MRTTAGGSRHARRLALPGGQAEHGRRPLAQVRGTSGRLALEDSLLPSGGGTEQGLPPFLRISSSAPPSPLRGHRTSLEPGACVTPAAMAPFGSMKCTECRMCVQGGAGGGRGAHGAAQDAPAQLRAAPAAGHPGTAAEAHRPPRPHLHARQRPPQPGAPIPLGRALCGRRPGQLRSGRRWTRSISRRCRSRCRLSSPCENCFLEAKHSSSLLLNVSLLTVTDKIDIDHYMLCKGFAAYPLWDGDAI